MTSETIEQKPKLWSPPESTPMPDIDEKRLELSSFSIDGELAPTEESQTGLMQSLYQNRWRSDTSYRLHDSVINVLAVDFKGVKTMKPEVMRDILVPAMRIYWDPNYLYFDNIPSDDESNIQLVTQRVLSQRQGLGKGKKMSQRLVVARVEDEQSPRLLGDQKVVDVFSSIWEELHKEGSWVHGFKFSQQVLGLSSTKLLSEMAERGIIAKRAVYSKNPYFRTLVS